MHGMPSDLLLPSAPCTAEDVAHVVDLCRQHHQELYLTWPGLGLMLQLAGTTFGDVAGFRDPSLHDVLLDASATAHNLQLERR